MGTFIRETMRGDERIRDKGSPQFAGLPTVTRSVEIITDPAPPLPDPIVPSGNVFGGGSSHPWKVSVTGEDEASVAAGSILIPVHLGDDENDRAPIVYVPSSYAGGTVEVTESGWLYAVLEYASVNSGVQTSFFDMSDFASPGLNAGLYLRYSADVDVIFSTSEPVSFAPTTTHVYWPIAEVDVTDNVLTVVQQVLTHNPTHELLYIGVASAPTV